MDTTTTRVTTWVPPPFEKRKECRSCGIVFGVFSNRRHHCRSCGKSFCESCTPSSAFIKDCGGRVRICTLCSGNKPWISKRISTVPLSLAHDSVKTAQDLLNTSKATSTTRRNVGAGPLLLDPASLKIAEDLLKTSPAAGMRAGGKVAPGSLLISPESLAIAERVIKGPEEVKEEKVEEVTPKIEDKFNPDLAIDAVWECPCSYFNVATTTCEACGAAKSHPTVTSDKGEELLADEKVTTENIESGTIIPESTVRDCETERVVEEKGATISKDIDKEELDKEITRLERELAKISEQSSEERKRDEEIERLKRELEKRSEQSSEERKREEEIERLRREIAKRSKMISEEIPVEEIPRIEERPSEEVKMSEEEIDEELDKEIKRLKQELAKISEQSSEERKREEEIERLRREIADKRSEERREEEIERLRREIAKRSEKISEERRAEAIREIARIEEEEKRLAKMNEEEEKKRSLPPNIKDKEPTEESSSESTSTDDTQNMLQLMISIRDTELQLSEVETLISAYNTLPKSTNNDVKISNIKRLQELVRLTSKKEELSVLKAKQSRKYDKLKERQEKKKIEELALAKKQREEEMAQLKEQLEERKKEEMKQQALLRELQRQEQAQIEKNADHKKKQDQLLLIQLLESKLKGWDVDDSDEHMTWNSLTDSCWAVGWCSLVSASPISSYDQKPTETEQWQTIHYKKIPFAAGGDRVVHFMCTHGSLNNKYVLKHFQKPEKREDKASNWMMVDLHCLAQMFASKFSARSSYTLQYISAHILQFESNLSQYWMVEEWVDGDHVKWNNNAGWTDPKEEVAQAYSHFTWQESKGQLIIVDVQGVKKSSTHYILTDPAIHTLSDSSGRWASGLNQGKAGIQAFFKTHTCNSVCKHFRLSPYTEKAFE